MPWPRLARPTSTPRWLAWMSLWDHPRRLPAGEPASDAEASGVQPIERRAFLKALALAGGGLAIRPALASTLGGLPGTTGASRLSRLDRSRSLTLVHTDLHNHSFISG